MLDCDLRDLGVVSRVPESARDHPLIGVVTWRTRLESLYYEQRHSEVKNRRRRSLSTFQKIVIARRVASQIFVFREGICRARVQNSVRSTTSFSSSTCLPSPGPTNPVIFLTTFWSRNLLEFFFFFSVLDLAPYTPFCPPLLGAVNPDPDLDPYPNHWWKGLNALFTGITEKLSPRRPLGAANGERLYTRGIKPVTSCGIFNVGVPRHEEIRLATRIHTPTVTGFRQWNLATTGSTPRTDG